MDSARLWLTKIHNRAVVSIYSAIAPYAVSSLTLLIRQDEMMTSECVASLAWHMQDDLPKYPADLHILSSP